jgi:UDP-galactopyranose mutase
MTRCAQMLEEKTHIDFIDVNLGCPIELVYQQVRKQFHTTGYAGSCDKYFKM